MKYLSPGTKISAVMFILIPVFKSLNYFLLTEQLPPLTLGLWVGVTVYAFVGYGVLKFNPMTRYVAIAFSVLELIAPFLGFFITPLLNPHLFFQVVEKHGFYITFGKPFIDLLVAYLSNIIYMVVIICLLTRPKVRQQFQKKPN